MMAKVQSFTIDSTVHQRFEYKYIVGEVEAQTIKHFIQPYVFPDSHGLFYTVNSLYLDTPNWALFWSSETGEKNRFKLRIRNYSEDPDQPVFFEVKRRINEVIKKERAAVHKRYVAQVLQGREIYPHYVVDPEHNALANLYRFRDYVSSMPAMPRLLVRYVREAYVSHIDAPVRVTFDRQLETFPVPDVTDDVWSDSKRWKAIPNCPVIMEIKFTDRFPSWLWQLVRKTHIIRDSVAKYVICVNTLKREGEVI